MEAAAQKVAMGPGWRPPGGIEGRGLEEGSRESQILEEEEGDLGHQRERQRTSLRGQGTGRGVDRSRGQTKNWKGRQRGMEIFGWYYCRCPTQSAPTLSPIFLPCPHDTLQPQGPRGSEESDCSPFSNGVQCTQVGPGITPCLLVCPVPCSLFVCLEVCVCCGCVRCLCLFMSAYF